MQIEKVSKKNMIIGIILSILCLAVGQIIAFGFGQLATKMGMTSWITNICMTILYIVITLIGLKLICQLFLKSTLKDYRIMPFKINVKYVILAVLIPLIVVGFLYLTGGSLIKGDQQNNVAVITSSILFYGLAVGIVEESIFRGMILGLLEKGFNKKIAILTMSIIFGLLHVLGRSMNFISIIQLLVAGIFVGILFSLITIESDSIWNGALVHAIWNMIFVGKIINIGTKIDNKAMYNFILSSKNSIITGGDFGVESSIVAIIVYIVFSVIIFLWYKKNKLKDNI